MGATVMNIFAKEAAAAALPALSWTLHELDPQTLPGIEHPVRFFAVGRDDTSGSA